MQAQSNQTKPLIKVENITRSFVTGELEVQVLKGIDLEIQAGEFVAIIGSSGSGKTTLMNILGCLDQPTSGNYWFAGEDVTALSSDELAKLRRESFGFVFQSYHLIATASALENVEIPAIYAGKPSAERKQKASELLTSLGLGERIHHKPNQLSGGQQQRVSIARALINGGQVILADEPTGALDSKSGADVMQLLSELSAQGHTVILITHDPKIAAHADRVIEIFDGEIIADQQNKTATTRPGYSKNQSQTSSALADIYEASLTAFRSLRANLFRSILTLLGIVIGVASVIVMLGIGDGAKREVVERISSMGTNLMIVRPGAPNMRGRADTATLVPEDVDAIKEIDNVLAAVPEVSSAATLRFGNADHRTTVNATSADYVIAQQWSVARGTFLTVDDEKTYNTVAVLGETVAKALFDRQDPIGEFVMINSIMFQVIGVMSPKGASPWGADQDDVVFVPFSTGSLRLFGQRFLRSATVAVADVSKIDATQQQVHQLLLQRHNGIEDFQIRNMASLLESVSETQNTLTILLGSIAAISLLVGGIGVMNIMLVSVTERTKEIGIRMATGARMHNILQQFLIEALVISALGGLIGVLLGLGIAALVEHFAMPVVYSIFPVAIAFSSAFLTGLIFGFLPARKAARLNPVLALSSK